AAGVIAAIRGNSRRTLDPRDFVHWAGRAAGCWVAAPGSICGGRDCVWRVAITTATSLRLRDDPVLTEDPRQLVRILLERRFRSGLACRNYAGRILDHADQLAIGRIRRGDDQVRDTS